MIRFEQTYPASRSRGWRTTRAVLGIGLLAGLLLAAFLTPSATGRGTHRQLGLPPCSFIMLFDRPCPSCGMTTSWANLVRGRVHDALAANVGGTLLCSAAIAAVPWLLASAVLGRPWLIEPDDRWLVAGGGLIVLVTLVDWLRRLGYF